MSEQATRSPPITFNEPWAATRRAAVYAAAMNLGIDQVMIRTLCGQQWLSNFTTNSDGFNNGLHHFGVFPSLLESSTPYLLYYGFSLLTKYTGAGKTFYRHTYNPNTVKATASATIPGVDKTYRNVFKTMNDTLSGGMIAVCTTKKD